MPEREPPPRASRRERYSFDPNRPSDNSHSASLFTALLFFQEVWFFFRGACGRTHIAVERRHREFPPTHYNTQTNCTSTCIPRMYTVYPIV